MADQSTHITADLTQMQAWIGRQFAITGVDEVTKSDIRRKLEPYGFFCPIHYNEDAARAHGFRTIVAPSTMVSLWALDAYWKPGDPSPSVGDSEKHGTTPGQEIPTPFKTGVVASSEWEYINPVYPGDRISGSWSLVDVKPRRTRLGEGAFLTIETTYQKQTDEIVAINRGTRFAYNADAERSASAVAKAESTPIDETSDLRVEPIDWSKQISLAEVRAGDLIAPHGLPLTYQRIVMSVAADRMFSPIHHNRDYARSAGLDDIIFNTRGYEMLFEITLREWMGLDGRLQKLGPFRMVKNSHPGDVLICRGRVTSVEGKGKKGDVHLEIWVESHRGVVAQGEADVEIPAAGK